MSVLLREIQGDAQQKPSRWRWVTRIVGIAPFATALLFATAAGLKIHYLRNYPISDTGLLHSRAFSTALLEAELALAAFLLYPRTRVIAVYSSLMLLIAFTGYNIWMWSRGTGLCGCLGVLSTRPSIMTAVDASVAATLALWVSSLSGVRTSSRVLDDPNSPQRSPDGREMLGRKRNSSWGLQLILMGCAVPGVMAIGLKYSRPPIVEEIMPIGIEILPPSVDIGNVAPGALATGEFSIINHRSEAITITGIKTDCTCTVATPNDMGIVAGGATKVNFNIRVPAYPNPQIRRAIMVELEMNGNSETVPVHVLARSAPDIGLTVFPTTVDFGTIVGNEGSKTVYFWGSPSMLSQLPEKVSLSEEAVSWRIEVDSGEMSKDTEWGLKTVTVSLKRGRLGVNAGAAIKIIDRRRAAAEITLPIRAQFGQSPNRQTQ